MQRQNILTDEAEGIIYLIDPKPDYLSSVLTDICLTYSCCLHSYGKAQARLLFCTCELGSLKLNSFSLFLSHELNAMHLAHLLVGINSLAGGTGRGGSAKFMYPNPSAKDMLN